MPDYRRAWSPGGTYFFTVVTNQRRPIFMESNARQILRQAFLHAKQKAEPFQVDALCLLPDHLHCIWSLPEDDCDYATRWKIIKARFSRWYRKQGGIPGVLSGSKIKKKEVGI